MLTGEVNTKKKQVKNKTNKNKERFSRAKMTCTTAEHFYIYFCRREKMASFHIMID